MIVKLIHFYVNSAFKFEKTAKSSYNRNIMVKLEQQRDISPTPLSRLNILVHPLFTAYYPSMENNYDYRLARDAAYGKSVESFIPKTPNEFLLIMPLVRSNESLISHVRRIKASKNRNGTWIDLYKRLKSSSKVGNVSLAPNTVENSPKKGIIDRLSDLGKTIDDRTEIVFGGEFIEACVDFAARQVLNSSRIINEVSIDKRVSVSSGDRVRIGISSIDLMSEGGINVMETNRFIYIYKSEPNS